MRFGKSEKLGNQGSSVEDRRLDLGVSLGRPEKVLYVCQSACTQVKVYEYRARVPRLLVTKGGGEIC